ncbi:MAG: hypothetical protein ABH871_07065 [Pseudomonadota bacterium]
MNRFISRFNAAVSVGIIIICLSSQLHAEQATQFNPKKYPTNKFELTRVNYRFGDIDIEVIHARYKLADTMEGYSHKY